LASISPVSSCGVAADISPGGWEWPADPAIAAALVRFTRFCRHDPGTGCVIWHGGRTAGGGHARPYGAFKFQRRRWFAHRWAARYIHGIDIDALQVDHCCPADLRPLPDTLCVQHLQALPPARNRELQTLRAREAQTLEQRRYWAHVRCGLEPQPDLPSDAMGALIPFYVEPPWLREAHAKAPADLVASGR